MGEIKINNRSRLSEGQAERFLSSLQQTIADNAKFAVLSASIGIAVSNALTDVDLLIRQSDSALYEAKRNGKKQYKIYHK
jgi:cyclic di-GMP phosphodiesterase Gmr